MASQILNLSYVTRLPDVSILFNESAQFSICAPITYLEAIVDGNLNGHVTEWVQVSGTIVVL